MRSASDDLTTRARIRDAAVGLFARQGFARTSLRQIAEDAGVSAALIVHHFGSKEGLREECDRFVVHSMLDDKEELMGADAAAMMRAALDSPERYGPMLDYLSRMLTEDTDASDRLFDAFLTGTRRMMQGQIAAGLMREPSDLEATAAYLTLYGLGPVVLQRQLTRAFGETRLSVALLERSTLPVLEMFTHGLYTDDRLLVAAREALGRRSGPRSDKGENDPNQDPDPPR
ncbi:TetR family transcriptional regulator [Microbacterium hydrocarbonoxydans]|uniref:TetR family transcriptional regulator n=1 Tax=Microbacterium hydrocarbonoxydans TaxID=273678 RepID=UPI0013DA5C85|nr:TetR family transcriptional regulator [Microbacterium hydrocarbonoxydans]